MRWLVLTFFGLASLYCQPETAQNREYKKADSIARAFHGASLENLPVLVHQLTANLDGEKQKFRSIFKWVCTNIENDYNGYQKTVRKRKRFINEPFQYEKWNKSYLPEVFQRLIKGRKTSCTGYAYLVQQMAQLAGLECKIVNGYARTSGTSINESLQPNHSWNAVKLDNDWFLCDATWSAGRVVFEFDVPIFKFYFSEAYFLSPTQLFAKNHYPLDTEWLLTNQTISYEEFREGPLIYKAAFEEKVLPLFPKTMNLSIFKGEELNIKFSMNNPEDSLKLLIIKKGKQKIVKCPSNPCKKVQTISQQFDKKGIYDVHLMVNNKICATYVISVTKDSFYP